MIVNASTMHDLVWSVVRPRTVVVDRTSTGRVTATVLPNGVWFAAQEGQRIPLDEGVDWVLTRMKYWRPGT